MESPLRRALERIGKHLALVQLGSHALGVLAPGAASINGRTAQGHHHPAVFDWVRQISLELRTDPVQFERVKTHYAYSIEHMVRKARRHGVPVILLTVPVNLRDWKPNASRNTLEGERRERWDRLYRLGRKALLEEEPRRARELLDEAIGLEPLHAASYFHRARAQEILGDSEHALRDYRSAADLDHNPFRAISDFNATLRRVAREWDHVHLVDAEAIFANASASSAPGFDLFLDYVHPTQRGNRILAESVFDEMAARKILNAKLVDHRFTYESQPHYRDGSPYDEERYVHMQITLLWLLGMNRQEESMLDKAWLLKRRAREGFPETRPAKVRQLMAFIAEIEATIPAYLELERRTVLGDDVSPNEAETIRARHASFYERNYSEGPRPWERRVSRSRNGER